MISWLAKIEAAANQGDWRAAAWKLQARYPEAYGSRTRVALTVDIRALAAKVAAELGVEVEALMAEAELRAYLNRPDCQYVLGAHTKGRNPRE